MSLSTGFASSICGRSRAVDADAIGRNSPLFAKLRESMDFIEGTQAFAQKRESQWKGKQEML